MPRPRMTPGQLGKVTFTQLASGWRARTNIRDLAGDLVPLSATAESETLAQQLIENQADAVWGGFFRPLSPDTTIADLAKTWLEEVASTELIGERQQSTVEAHANTVKSLILPGLGAVRLSSVNVALCNRFLLSLEKNSRSKATKAKTVLNQMLRLAVEHGALPTNPMREARRVRRADAAYFELTNEQLANVLVLIRKWRGVNPERRGGGRPDTELLSDMILLILATSMRPGEVLALRCVDVDIASSPAEVHVNGTISLTARDGLTRKSTPKHENQERYIPVPEFARSILERRLDAAILSGNEFLFATRTGGPYQLQNVARIMRSFRDTNRDALLSIGFEPEALTFKSFRKAAATAVKRDGGIELASQLLGHADFRTTQAYYAAPTRRVSTEAADAISRAFPSAAI